MKKISLKGLKFNEPLIFEKSSSGKVGYSFRECLSNGSDPEEIFDKKFIRTEIKDFPEVSEVEVIRHFTRLSQLNYGLDSGFYPLGSCTMKYNPKVNEDIALLKGFNKIHPYFPEEFVQGALQVIYELQEKLKKITGFDAVTLQPSAGAHAEFTGLKIIKAYHQSNQDNKREYILIPDSAHGTNPASSTLAGFKVKNIKSGPGGYLQADTIAQVMDETVAGIMITNPNTLGVFEKEIDKIIKIVHERGGLVYGDGANMNALMGKLKPADIGFDVMHLNLHKTFSTPHGGGGPGSGPVLVTEKLRRFLPLPLVTKSREGDYLVISKSDDSIGRMKSFFGNFSVWVKALSYILEMGERGLTQATEDAVLSANYIRESLKDYYHLPYETDSLHEVVFSDKSFKDKGIETMDLAKRLIDYGIHPATVYFPLIVSGAIMIEPTETESKEEIDYFINVMKNIANEINETPDLLHMAPQISVRKRLDEVRAAKHPKLRWYKPVEEDEE